jgi:hypothetical protein
LLGGGRLINLLTAIFGKFANSSFSNDVGGRIFLDETPTGTEFPYCVYFIVTATPDNAFQKKGKEILIQFSLFSSSQSAAEITGMYDDLIALFDECTLTSGLNFINENDDNEINEDDTNSVTDIYDETFFNNMHWSNLTTMTEDITTPDGTQTVKHWAVDFSITTQES